MLKQISTLLISVKTDITKVEIAATIVKIACVGNWSVFVDYLGNTWLCGDNEHGQLGFDDVVDRHTPEVCNKLKYMNTIPFRANLVAIDEEGNVYLCGYLWARSSKFSRVGALSFAAPITRIKSAASFV